MKHTADEIELGKPVAKGYNVGVAPRTEVVGAAPEGGGRSGLSTWLSSPRTEETREKRDFTIANYFNLPKCISRSTLRIYQRCRSIELIRVKSSYRYQNYMQSVQKAIRKI